MHHLREVRLGCLEKQITVRILFSSERSGLDPIAESNNSVQRHISSRDLSLLLSLGARKGRSRVSRLQLVSQTQLGFNL